MFMSELFIPYSQHNQEIIALKFNEFVITLWTDQPHKTVSLSYFIKIYTFDIV